MEELSVLQKVSVWLLPVLFAITVHEVAHGWVARQLGDPTAMMLGRLTLNPVKHIDPIGTVLVPAAMLILTGFIFGWARPVPVNWSNLRRPRRDMALVALAGPGANLLMGLGWALVLKAGLLYHATLGWLAEPMIFAGVAGVFVNAILLVLNLLPLPPLDGGRVVSGVLPPQLARQFGRIEPYGIVVLVALLVTGLLGRLIGPVIEAFLTFYAALAGVPLEGLVRALAGLT